MTNKGLAVSIAYVAVFLQLATYVAHDVGWLSDGGLYWTVLYATSLALLGAVLWVVGLRRRSRSQEPQPAKIEKGADGIEKQLLTIALLAIVAFGGVQVGRALGYLPDRNLYVTLNIALPVLWLAMTYQVYLRRKKNSAAR